VFDSEKPVKSILANKDKEPPKIQGKQLNIEKKKLCVCVLDFMEMGLQVLAKEVVGHVQPQRIPNA